MATQTFQGRVVNTAAPAAPATDLRAVLARLAALEAENEALRNARSTVSVTAGKDKDTKQLTGTIRVNGIRAQYGPAYYPGEWLKILTDENIAAIKALCSDPAVVAAANARRAAR